MRNIVDRQKYWADLAICSNALDKFLSVLNKGHIPEDMNLRIIWASFNCSDVLSRRVRILQDYLSKLKISHGIVTADDGSNEGGKTGKIG